MSNSKLEKVQDDIANYMGSHPVGIIHGCGRAGGCVTVYGTTEEVLKLVPDIIDGINIKKIICEQAVLQ